MNKFNPKIHLKDTKSRYLLAHNCVIYNTDLSITARLLYIHMYNIAEQSGTFFESISKTAKSLGMSIRTIKRAKSELIDSNFIVSISERGKPSVVAFLKHESLSSTIASSAAESDDEADHNICAAENEPADDVLSSAGSSDYIDVDYDVVTDHESDLAIIPPVLQATCQYPLEAFDSTSDFINHIDASHLEQDSTDLLMKIVGDDHKEEVEMLYFSKRLQCFGEPPRAPVIDNLKNEYAGMRYIDNCWIIDNQFEAIAAGQGVTL